MLSHLLIHPSLSIGGLLNGENFSRILLDTSPSSPQPSRFFHNGTLAIRASTAISISAIELLVDALYLGTKVWGFEFAEDDF